MPQPNDLNRSLVALDQNSTIIAVVELSHSSWLVGGVVRDEAQSRRAQSAPAQPVVPGGRRHHCIVDGGAAGRSSAEPVVTKAEERILRLMRDTGRDQFDLMMRLPVETQLLPGPAGLTKRC